MVISDPADLKFKSPQISCAGFAKTVNQLELCVSKRSTRTSESKGRRPPPFSPSNSMTFFEGILKGTMMVKSL